MEEIQLAQSRAYNADYLYYRTPLIISGFTGCCYTRNACYSPTWAGYPYLISATPIPDVPRAGNKGPNTSVTKFFMDLLKCPVQL